MTAVPPRGPNILVTGTPGTGKSSLGAMLQSELGIRHIEVGKLVRENRFFSDYNAEFDTFDVTEDDENRLMDFIEGTMNEGGNVVDYHSCGFFPERWFGLVIVLRASTDVLFDRLTERGYSPAKREENMEAEIMGVVLEEAVESYDASHVCVRQSNTLDDLAQTVDFVAAWLSSHGAPAAQLS